MSATVQICSYFEEKIEHLEDPEVDERIILRWIYRKWDGGGAWTGSIWLGIGTGKSGNEPSDSIKCREFLD